MQEITEDEVNMHDLMEELERDIEHRKRLEQEFQDMCEHFEQLNK